MKHSSIKGRLVGSLTLFIGVGLVPIAALVYLTIKSSLYQQVDHRLKKVADLLVAEVEVDDGMIDHEWLEDLLRDPVRSKNELVQAYEVRTKKTLKSPALKDFTLPQKTSSLGYSFTNLVNFTDQPLRVATASISLQRAPNSAAEIVVFSIAEDISQIEKTLFWIGIISSAVLLVAVASTTWIIRTMVNSSLKPIRNVEHSLALYSAHSTELLPTTSGVPTELKGLVEQFTTLLNRVNSVRQREKNFSANAAHELRTPLSGVLATLQQLLNRERSPQRYQAGINRALDSTRQLQTLVEQLLQFSRAKNEAESYEPKEVSLTNSINQGIELYQAKADERGISITHSLTASATVTSNKELLQSIINNLLSNATSHASASSVLSIDLQQQGDQLLLSISNKVEDLPEEHLSKLTEPFYRVDSVREIEDTHLGLGLALASDLAESLDHKLSINLKQGQFIAILCFKQKK